MEAAIMECYAMDDSDDSSDEEYKAPESGVCVGGVCVYVCVCVCVWVWVWVCVCICM